jgi:DNA modification methylase
VQLLDEQSGERPAGGSRTGLEHSNKTSNTYGKYKENNVWNSYNDSGGASRFFYSAKVKGFERAAGLTVPCPHPTMKPIQLIEWLSRLLLPPKHITERRLLVPFAGSGSEMIGAHLAGWEHVDGVEMTPEYIPLAQSRLNWWTRFKTYAQAESVYAGERQSNELETNGQLKLFTEGL